MQTTMLVKTAIAAWESGDMQELAACLAEDVVCRNWLPQPIGKQSFLRFARALTRAIPDWSFQATLLNEHPTRRQGTQVHIATHISGTHTGDFSISELPIIPPTETRIALPLRYIDFIIRDDLIEEIDLNGRPTMLEEVISALGMELR